MTDSPSDGSPADDAQGVPPYIDASRPHPARMYDYYIGGKNHFAADRLVADKALASWPAGRIGLRENRAFLGRAVRYLAAEAGIRQFLDLGSGLPATTTVLIGAAGVGGNFVIGYNAEDVGDAATFWGFNWRTVNHVRVGSVPANFRGWEDQAALPACGSNWTTSPFDSATPPSPAPLPDYIVTIVTDRFSTTFSHRYVGSTVHLVIVRTDPGYQPFPKYTGTGTVVATIC